MSLNEQDTRQSQLSDIRNILAKTLNGKRAVGYQTLDVLTSAVSTLTVPSTATEAWISVDATSSTTTNSVRYTLDGTTPVTGTSSASTHGMIIGDGTTIVIKGNSNLNNMKIIATAAQRFVKVQYFA